MSEREEMIEDLSGTVDFEDKLPNTREEFEEVCDSLPVKITNNEKAVARYIWTTQQKKIDELEREKALSDDNLQDYIKMANDRQLRICNLEREKKEAVNALIEVAIPLEDSSGGWGYYNELLQGIIEKLTGKTWEEIKAGKHE